MPALKWDEGTAYDFFVSLFVLHRPAMFGARASWAAGVRSRLPAAQREFLEKAQSFLPVPLSWLYLLPAEAKNTAGALHHLAQLPAAERLPSLFIIAEIPIEAHNVLRNLTLRQTWSSAEQEVLRAALSRRGIFPRPNALFHLREAWLDLSSSGDLLLQALNTYYQVFFEEEEVRIRPYLQASLHQAREQASQYPIPQLLENLSRGVHFEQAETASEIILVPSYWASPLVFYNQFPPDRLLVLFGSRPEAHDLSAGETLPLDLVENLKAIADPTRLRILRYLAECPQTPSQLARQLRLRPPTVIHHLNALRLAGLVEVILPADGERGYSLRREAVNQSLSLLIDFLTPAP